jgi:hypothetical protein
MKIEMLINAIIVGLGATLFLDFWILFLKHVFKIPAPNFCLVGRWFSHMIHGAFKHPSIAAAVQRPAECAIGWMVHYTIGVVFALAFVVFVGSHWLQSPALMPALVFGLVTSVFPFFIMHPAFGIGIAASKTPNPMQAQLRALMNHAAFGIGLYISAVVVGQII